MEKKALFYFLSLVVLFLAGCSSQQPLSQNRPTDSIPEQKIASSEEQKQILECNKITDEMDREMCYLDIGLNASDTSEYLSTANGCADFIEGTMKALCYSGFAVKQNNLQLCNNLSTDKYSTICRDLFYRNLAMGQGSAKQCENIFDKDEAIRCVTDLAIKKEDYTICDVPMNDFWPKIGDSSEKDECYTQVADKKNDKTICDKISAADSRSWCYNKIQ